MPEEFMPEEFMPEEFMPPMINTSHNHETRNSYLQKILGGLLSLLALNTDFLVIVVHFSEC